MSQSEVLLDWTSPLQSPPLFNYLRQEIPIEDLRDYASPRRIKSIDFVKGLAIILIMMAHVSEAWLDSDWVYIYAMMFCIMDVFGPSLFVFLSALSVVFSIKKKQGKVHPKIIRNQILSRGASIAVIGMIINLAWLNQGPADYRPFFPLSLWGWNILMFLGFSQVFSYYALKLTKKWRIIIGLTIIFISMPLRQFLIYYREDYLIVWILHFIITSPAPQLPLFPWLSICFLSTIFGEYLYEAMIEGTEDAYVGLIRIFLFWGVIFIIFGVIAPSISLGLPPKISWGWELQTTETMNMNEYPHLYVLGIMNQQKYYKFLGIPLFLIRSTTANMLYNLGAALLIIGIFFYIIDLKNKENNFTSMLIYYGKISLSLFLIHFIFILIFVSQFSIVVFPFVILAYVGLMGFSMYIWNEYGNGVGSPEWVMIQISRIGQKTGEQVKRELRKTEDLIKNFTKMIMPKKTLQKMEDFIAERKEKRLEKIRKQELRKKRKKLEDRVGHIED
ncbi:MAG: heparan-alpha-glucosaminide N-acetyltransferase domain-containing protein [Candidatus Thorarchaeota archaeon]